MYTDGGSNFIGAEPLWREITENWAKIANSNDMRFKNLEWQWNPPTASHMNGAVESLINSVKKAMDGMQNGHLRPLTQDEWQTLMCEVTYIVNSRPLFPGNPTDPLSDAMFISPNSILHGHHIVVDQPNVREAPNPRQRFNVVEQKARLSWEQWMKFMPYNLNKRTKWFIGRRNLEVGDCVIIKRGGVDGIAPRAIWDIGDVKQVYPGADGYVRRALISVRGKELVRPIHKLVLVATAEELKEDLRTKRQVIVRKDGQID